MLLTFHVDLSRKTQPVVDHPDVTQAQSEVKIVLKKLSILINCGRVAGVTVDVVQVFAREEYLHDTVIAAE
jgi:hypothetical protein